MKFSEFKLTVSEFKTHPKSGRNIWLWNGDLDDLNRQLPQDIISIVDLGTLLAAAQPKTKGDRDIANEINRLLSEELQKMKSAYKPPHILLLTGCYLLARYNTGLTPIFNHHVGNGIATILVLPIIKRKVALPDYVRYEPVTTLSYLAGLLGNENLIEGNVNG